MTQAVYRGLSSGSHNIILLGSIWALLSRSIWGTCVVQAYSLKSIKFYQGSIRVIFGEYGVLLVSLRYQGSILGLPMVF